MFILSKRNILLPSLDGSQTFRVARDYVGDVPDWAAETPYFKDLVADGKIVITGKSDKALQQAEEKPVKIRRKAEE